MYFGERGRDSKKKKRELGRQIHRSKQGRQLERRQEGGETLPDKKKGVEGYRETGRRKRERERNGIYGRKNRCMYIETVSAMREICGQLKRSQQRGKHSTIHEQKVIRENPPWEIHSYG